MSKKGALAGPDLVDKHIRALARLPYGSLFFDRTAAVDFRLVEEGQTELADELAMLEERLAKVVDGVGKKAVEPGGVGRLLDADAELKRDLRTLLARIVPALGNPQPGDLGGRTPVALDLHLTPAATGSMGLVRKRRIDAGNN